MRIMRCAWAAARAQLAPSALPFVLAVLTDMPAGTAPGLAFLVRASLGWYLLAVIALLECALALAVLVYGLPQRTPTELFSAIVMGLIVPSAIGLVMINLWEEIVWMGFVQGPPPGLPRSLGRHHSDRGVVHAPTCAAVRRTTGQRCSSSCRSSSW
jgi:hypothetical protein